MSRTADRTKTLELLQNASIKIRRNLVEVALASGINPEDLELEQTTTDDVLTHDDFVNMKAKLVSWYDRELANVARSKVIVETIPLPQTLKD